MFFEVSFVGLQHTVEPWKEFFGAMITMQHNGTRMIGEKSKAKDNEVNSHPVGLGNSADMVGSSDSSSD